jgi:hypothetical protein
MKPPQDVSTFTSDRKLKPVPWSRKFTELQSNPKRKSRTRKKSQDDYSDWRRELL